MGYVLSTGAVTGIAASRGLYFVLRAAALMLLLYGLYYYPYPVGSWPDELIQGYLRAQARGAAALIRWFDDGVAARGTTIAGPFPLEVVRTCSSLDAQALYAAAVVAFPSRWRAKLLGLLIGFVVLTALNMIRIASLYAIGANAPNAFDAVHEELFPLVLVLIACSCFAAWARWLPREAHARAAG